MNCKKWQEAERTILLVGESEQCLGMWRYKLHKFGTKADVELETYKSIASRTFVNTNSNYNYILFYASDNKQIEKYKTVIGKISVAKRLAMEIYLIYTHMPCEPDAEIEPCFNKVFTRMPHFTELFSEYRYN